MRKNLPKSHAPIRHLCLKHALRRKTRSGNDIRRKSRENLFCGGPRPLSSLLISRRKAHLIDIHFAVRKNAGKELKVHFKVYLLS